MIRHTEPPLEQGIRIGPYQVDQLVTKTRFSRIARATHTETGDSVALKVPTENGVYLLENERDIYCSLAGVTSSYLARMHGTGAWGGAPFIATDWQPNGTLQELLPLSPIVAKRKNARGLPSTPQDLQRNLRIIADGTTGLAELHKVKIIHCDIKLANIAVSNNTGKLLDFGVAVSVNDASHIGEGTVFGTPGQSIPPEAYMYGNVASPTRDVWAMAATAFRALSGVKPFGESYSWDPLECHNQVNRKPDLTLRDFYRHAPSDLDRVITEALNPKPKKRPSVSEMRDVFNRAAGQDGIFER